MNVKIRRRENLRLLAQALGGVTELANFLGKSVSQMSHLTGHYVNKNIGDRLAAEIEKAFAKPPGWLDGDYTGQETDVIATAIPPAACYKIPFLKKYEVVDWILYPNQRLSGCERHDYLYTSATVSPSAYAYQVHTDSMEGAQPNSFPQGTIVIVDPAIPMQNDTFALVRVEHEFEPMLRQIVYAEAKVFLQALNHRYPTIEFKPHFLYCGMVREAMLIKPGW